jgi:serine/threonine protein kinase
MFGLGHGPRLNYNQRLYREVIKWKHLKHPNIVPFLGILPVHPQICVITDWRPNKNIAKYILEKPEVNRFKLVSNIS